MTVKTSIRQHPSARMPRLAIVASMVLCLMACRPALAQQVLPKPEPPFGGKIGETYKDSTADFPKPVAAPAGAPNVLIVILDDVGFGHAGTFGGAVATPTMDRLAKEGLRYNTFHTTALCSPTRGALLTGRNHHSAGTGVIIELGTGYPGYRGGRYEGVGRVRRGQVLLLIEQRTWHGIGHQRGGRS